MSAIALRSGRALRSVRASNWASCWVFTAVCEPVARSRAALIVAMSASAADLASAICWFTGSSCPWYQAFSDFIASCWAVLRDFWSDFLAAAISASCWALRAATLADHSALMAAAWAFSGANVVASWACRSATWAA